MISLRPVNWLRINLSMMRCMQLRGTKLPSREKYQLVMKTSICTSLLIWVEKGVQNGCKDQMPVFSIRKGIA
jgi:hypothetical protein